MPTKKMMNMYWADSRFVPSQWEMVLLCNDVSLAGCKPRISPAAPACIYSVDQPAQGKKKYLANWSLMIPYGIVEIYKRWFR